MTSYALFAVATFVVFVVAFFCGIVIWFGSALEGF